MRLIAAGNDPGRIDFPEAIVRSSYLASHLITCGRSCDRGRKLQSRVGGEDLHESGILKCLWQMQA